jgi:hypothetical protein
MASVTPSKNFFDSNFTCLFPKFLDVLDGSIDFLLPKARLGISWHSGSPAFVRVDGPAPIAEAAFDLAAPAAFTALTAKMAKHLIEDVRAIFGSLAIWTREFPVA